MICQRLYNVESSENFGRYLVAGEDIPAKTLILQEPALIFAPADEVEDDNRTMIFCLECSLHISKEDDDKCPKCGWPLCSKCSKDNKPGKSHDKYECSWFQENATSFPPPQGWPILFKSVLVLRILQLVENDPDTWPRFFSLLEHHTEIREKKERCRESDYKIMENMKHFGIPNEKLENVKRIIGIINVNGFGANKGNDVGHSLRKTKSLFEQGSLFAHSCSPNCTWKIEMTPGNGFIPVITVYTSVPMSSGEALTIAYNTRHLFSGTLRRQILIESIAHFECRCKRCLDPSELGTFMSALRCFKCEKGFLISSNAKSQDSDWKCLECKGSESVNKVVYFTTDVEDCLDKIESYELDKFKEVEMLEKLFWKHCDKLLHKNHYVLQEISTRMLEILVESLENASLEVIDIFLWHCEHLRQVADIILPGFNGYQDDLKDYNSEGLYYKEIKSKELQKETKVLKQKI